MKRIINIIAQTSHNTNVQRQMNDIVEIVFVEEALGLDYQFVDIAKAIKEGWEMYIGDWDDKVEYAFDKALKMNKVDTD
mgnify:CR=1 FL=1|jgi:hypothetical protein